jgi:hypothetical protein
MQKPIRYLVLTGWALAVFALPESAFSKDDAGSKDETGTPALGIQVGFSNGRMVVTNAAPNAPVVVASAAAPTTVQDPLLDHRMPEPIQSLVHSISRTHGVDPRLVAAVMKVESNYNRWARSPKGALGLMQLIPETGARFGVRDFFDPAQNIEGGVRYLKFLADKFQANLDLQLAAYNAGENLVARIGRIPSIRETRDYVNKIRKIYRPSERPALAASAPVPKAAVKPPEPEAEPPITIYKSIDTRGVIHFTNFGGPPN